MTMTTLSVRVNGERIQTRDSRRPLAARDTVLNGGFRIDTDTRILPEPAPPAPDLGVRYDGSTAKPVDVDVIFNSFTNAIGVLSAPDIAKIKALMLKYAGPSSGTTTPVGITTSDAARARDAVQELSNANKAFWDARLEGDELRLFGR